MITKYYCIECDCVKPESQIAYKYQINESGRYSVWEYVCKECKKQEVKGK